MPKLSREQWIETLAERHGAERQQRFLNSVVAVCGLGGLGSNIAVSLTRAGIGKLILIDFDKVDPSNLNRQQYKMSQLGMYKVDALTENLREITPYVELEGHVMKLTEDNAAEVLREADIVCEAFDRAEAKAMLVNAVLQQFKDKIVISGSGMAGFKSANLIQTKKVAKRLYIAGDEVSDVNDGVTTEVVQKDSTSRDFEMMCDS